jgi:hypothetical protein
VFVLGLALLVPETRGLADDSVLRVDTAQLQERLGRLEAREDAAHAEGAIEQARRALETASSGSEDASSVLRAQRIARAAMVLAERQLGRRQAEAEVVATQRRLLAIRERALAQRRVLEALLKERAALARAAEQP